MRTNAVQPNRSTLVSAPTIRRADLAEPLDWLAAGIRSFAAAPAGSLLYGTLFAAACWSTLALTRSLPWFALAFLTGLMLLGPFLAAGLYVAARQQDAGEPISIRGSFALLWERRTNLSLFALFLGLIAAAWVRLSALLFAIQFTTLSPSTNDYLGLLSGHFDPVVTGFFVGIGLLLAGTVFVTSAVAIPMILDRDVGPITAMQTSYRTVLTNWPAMLLWAALIVLLSGIGLLTLFVGMIPLFPVLGYATWHSYRRLVA
ncbi:DUF2189 domain-containing protein [Thiocystis violascens]|uniref:Putative integral membrane protein n=1 Tax=Thiocystis violascens (strain ATCC 17096 / DSM 198 / 6111) TaxID=765911 RepID=I3Y5K4_THIV6|nr:DUF2189 domain-containing protein [Thiocystis violascens]AFL72272.1 putative integral membrane protein [Thiocystis violascens DSM 198]